MSTLRCFDGRSKACTGLFLRFRTSPLVAMMVREVESDCEKALVAAAVFIDRRRVRCAIQRLCEGINTREF